MKAPGFNPCAYKVNTWFQAFAFKWVNLCYYDEAAAKKGKGKKGKGGGKKGKGGAAEEAPPPPPPPPRAPPLALPGLPRVHPAVGAVQVESSRPIV